MTQPITDFKKAGREFLSNMYPCRITFRARTFKCSESAYQAEKCANDSDREQFVGLDGFAAKKLGRKIAIRSDWEAVKVSTMRHILLHKFRYSEPLGEALLATGDAEIIEGNHWNDTFWGVCNGIGQNWLGRLLMERRSELQQIDREQNGERNPTTPPSAPSRAEATPTGEGDE